MATWSSSSNARERAEPPPELPPSLAEGASRPLRMRGIPGRWSRLGLALLFVIWPGSINLAILLLLFLVGLGRVRLRRVSDLGCMP